MNSGKLRHRITIQTPTRTLSKSGETSRSWSEFAKRWARVKQLGGTESENDSEAIEGRTNFEILIRKTDSITTDMRIIFRTRTLNIESITADPTDEKSQKIICTEINETT